MKYQINLFIKRIFFLIVFFIIFDCIAFLPGIIFNNNTNNVIKGLIIIAIVELVFIIIANFGDFIALLKWKKVETNGIKVTGKVIGAHIRRRYDSAFESFRYDPSFIVSYTNPNTNIEETYMAPMTVSPLKLASKECTVYICGQRIYVTNFKHKKFNDKTSIWTEKEIYNYKKYGHLDENNYENSNTH